MSDIQLPPVIFGPTYQARIAHRPVFGDECVVCGKRCSHPLFEVRLDAALDQSLAFDDPIQEDGGMFPVGTRVRQGLPGRLPVPQGTFALALPDSAVVH